MGCHACTANSGCWSTATEQPKTSTSHAEAERVLSTLNKDGSRRWLRPKLSPGPLLNARRFMAYGLIILFAALPWITINGKPAVLLDLPAREFTFFGVTFLPTDTLLLMLFLGIVFVLIFLLTALFGRLWCGWACPQTVYLEFIYRPIERLLEGKPNAKGKLSKTPSGWRFVAKYVIYLIFSLLIAHVFVSYFVGVDELFKWVRQSPFEHPTSFLVMAAVTGLMMFDFAFFREQMCIVACPYGRFQSVMLDRSSLIVSYDYTRGEPRGKARRAPKGKTVELPQLGDCIDCNMCVATCPTGIDIREGLQMECLHCTQCIDACNTVMQKIGRPKGLIRYTSQEALEHGKAPILRPRVILYPLVLAIFVAVFIVLVTNRSSADVTLLRAIDTPYVTLDDGMVRNSLRIKIVNRSDEQRTYDIMLLDAPDATLSSDQIPLTLEPGAMSTVSLHLDAPRTIFKTGRADLSIRVTDNVEYDDTMKARLQGPWGNGQGNTNESGAGH